MFKGFIRQFNGESQFVIIPEDDEMEAQLATLRGTHTIVIEGSQRLEDEKKYMRRVSWREDTLATLVKVAHLEEEQKA